MKRLAVENLAGAVDALVQVAPKEKILLTRNGQPFAFVVDASKYDWEDIGYITDPEFWKMIRERRAEKGSIPFEQVVAEMEQREKVKRTAAPRSSPAKKKRTKSDRSAA